MIKRTESMEKRTAEQLKIINLNSMRSPYHPVSEDDSFYTDDVFNGKASRSARQLLRFVYEGKVRPTLKFFPNVFKRMYPQVEFHEIENIYDMEKQDLLKYYEVPELIITQESDGLKGEKLRRFRQSWLEGLTSSCRLFRHRGEKSSYQLYFHSDLELKSLVSAILDVEAYPKWHPQVKQTQIHAVIAADNIIMFSVVLAVPGVEGGLTFHFLIHLFKVHRQYYLAHKTIQMEDEKPPSEASWRKYVPWGEKPNPVRHLDLLVMRLSPDKLHKLNELFMSVAMPGDMRNGGDVLNYFSTSTS